MQSDIDNPLKVEARGLIFDAAGQAADRRVGCFTALSRLSSGKVLCGFQNGPAKQAATSTVRLSESTDGGRSWRLLPFVFASSFAGVRGSLAAIELVESEPGRLLAFATWFDRTDPERPLFDPVTEGILKSKLLWAESRDEGRHWTDWRELRPGELRGATLTGPVLRWSDGTIGVALESFKEFDDPAPGRHAAWLLLSSDGGRSFSEPRLVTRHPAGHVFYWDQRLCIGHRPGEMTVLFWTHDRTAQRDLDVHLSHGRIDDRGLQVGPPRRTGIRGQIAAPLWWRRWLLAFVVDREHPATMSLWRSSDEGATWPSEHRLIVYRHDERATLSQGAENIDFKQYWEDMGRWSFGHPALLEVDETRLLLAWYAGTPDCMSIHWAIVCPDKQAGRS